MLHEVLDEQGGYVQLSASVTRSGAHMLGQRLLCDVAASGNVGSPLSRIELSARLRACCQVCS